MPSGTQTGVTAEPRPSGGANSSRPSASQPFRVGHLGYFGEFDIITCLAALEMTLAELGYDFERGSGIKAAEAVFMGE